MLKIKITAWKIIVALARPLVRAGLYTYLKRYANELQKIAKLKVEEAKKHNKPLRVAFMIYDLSFWKNEALFEAMLQDERFLPAFWVLHYPFATNEEIEKERRNRCLEYIHKKSYLHFIDCSLAELREKFAPDYVFVVHPYGNHIPFDIKDLKSELLCFIPYGYSNLDIPRVYNDRKIRYFYRYYLESAYIQRAARKFMYTKACNTRVTGLPMADLLLKTKLSKTDTRKYIIWAPHWTIDCDNGGSLGVSAFLYMAEGMVELARKFQSQVVFVLKPHPLLKSSLYRNENWGIERTTAYFRLWQEEPNMHLEEGGYVEAFAQSDAIIHDCGSFIQEYLLMNKPSLYIRKPGAVTRFNRTTKQALECYQIGSTMSDVERFIQNVIAGIDPKTDERADFLNSYLLPNGQTPVTNIITDLLNP